jgi:hypothetical protein
MFECQTWSLAQKELRGMEEVTEGWRKLHNKEFHDLYSPSHIITVIKSRKIRWARNVVGMEQNWNDSVLVRIH